MNLLQKYFRQIGLITLIIVIVISAFSIWRASKMKFSYDFESFFPQDDQELKFYYDFRNNFEYENEFLLIGIENKKGIFRNKFLRQLRTFSDSLARLKNIVRVVSPANLKYTVIGFLGPEEFLYLDPDRDDLYASDSVRIYQSPELVGSFFAKDVRSVSVYIKTTDGISKIASDSLLKKIETLLSSFHFDRTHIAGKIKAQKVYLEKIRSEFVVFFISSFLLVVLFLYISYRSFWGIWVPMLIVILAICWTLGLMNIFGKDLDIICVLLPTMIFIVGMSDAVHLITKYLEEIRLGKEKLAAIITTLKEVGFPTFLTLVTTAIGFLTLLFSSIKPIRDFGIYTSIGVFVSFILAYSLLPFILYRIKKPDPIQENKQGTFWEKKLEYLFEWIMTHKKFVSISMLFVVLISIGGIFRINQNNTLLEQMSRKDEVRSDFQFFEEHYAGVRPFEMLVSVKGNQIILDSEIVSSMDKLENYLRTSYGVGFILSPVTLIKQLNRSLNEGDAKYFRLPEKAEYRNWIREELKKRRRTKNLRLFFSKDCKTARITGKMHDEGSKIIRDKNKKLDEYIRTNMPASCEYKITGGAVMIDRHNEYLVKNMIQGFVLSLFAVALVILLIHRSIKMVIISIVPNLIPILFIGGLMGYAGIELKSSTSIIFSIAFGIATDDTIHFLGRLKLEMNKNLSILEATRRTYIFTGKAVVITSLILSAGFLTLITSNFQSTFYFGLLVSLTLAVAVIVELLLFPLLVVWLYTQDESKYTTAT